MKALAKTADPHPRGEAPDEQAALRAEIARIIQKEYSGDIDSEFWRAPARAAADRIVEMLFTSSRA